MPILYVPICVLVFLLKKKKKKHKFLKCTEASSDLYGGLG